MEQIWHPIRMGIPAQILNAFRGYRTSFDLLEQALLSATSLALPTHVQGAFERRLNSINMVQPILGRLEINLYERCKRSIYFREEGRIVKGDDPIKIAIVDYHPNQGASGFRATLYCGRGVLTSIEFDRPTEHFSVTDHADLKVMLEPNTPWI